LKPSDQNTHLKLMNLRSWINRLKAAVSFLLVVAAVLFSVFFVAYLGNVQANDIAPALGKVLGITVVFAIFLLIKWMITKRD